MAPLLVGRWFGRFDDDPIAFEFFPDGRLTIVVLRGDRRQTLCLSYRVDGSQLVTDQPDRAAAERSAFSCDGDRLAVELAGRVTRLRR